jgi:hypothetical protein
VRKLTIGIPTYDDYDGLYFTIQSIRMFHQEILNELEFVIIDNNPDSTHGKNVRELIEWIDIPTQYLPFTKYRSTTVKDKVFSLSDTPYTLCMDSHVLLYPNSLKKLIQFYDQGLDNGNLLQGPLFYDDFKNYSTHFNDEWDNFMWGKWETDIRGGDENNEPFEIPAQGMGLFTCRTDSWLGFNKNFRGFGGEEKYIHEKYKQKGKQTICLPFLRWMHRFNRPNGIPYPNNLADRYRNYLIGHIELNLDQTKLENHFKKSISKEDMLKIKEEVQLIIK